MDIWLITDTHFGHEAMLSYCGRPEGFENIILKNMSTLTKNDILIHLGDFCIGDDSKWHTEFMNASSCIKWLVKGNHDNKSNSWYMNHGWDFVGEYISDMYFGKKILFSHMPQYYREGDNNETLYDVNIHGHFHNTAHRSTQKEMEARRDYRQKLLAIEYIDYKPILLKNFLGV